jgi:hypothetical protein
MDRFPEEDWAQILTWTARQMGSYELRAPWFSVTQVRRFYPVMHLFLASVTLWTRNNPGYEPPSTFRDPSTYHYT